MYCSQCGNVASGSYCSSCGAPLSTAGSADAGASPFAPDEIRYDVLLQHPDVRQMIAEFAAQSRRPISAEQFLKLCDMALSPIIGIELAQIAAIVQPIYARLGIRTGKTRAALFSVPTGPMLIGTLCSLALRGQGVRGVRQGSDGCLLEAEIPSDMWSFEGDLLVTVGRHEGGTLIEAATNIKGQLFDWGKSNRCLETFFSDLIEVVSTWSDDVAAA